MDGNGWGSTDDTIKTKRGQMIKQKEKQGRPRGMEESMGKAHGPVQPEGCGWVRQQTDTIDGYVQIRGAHPSGPRLPENGVL